MEKQNITAHIECNNAGYYSVYFNEELPFGFFGEGRTADEAKADFLAVYEEMRQNHKAETGENVDCVFSFVYDTSALLQTYKSVISFAGLAQETGISKTMLSQYACGTRNPRPAQRQKIIDGIHAIGNRCLAAAYA